MYAACKGGIPDGAANEQDEISKESRLPLLAGIREMLG